MVLTYTGLFAQSTNLSVGFIGTQFINLNDDNRISEIDNPLGYGVIVGYKLNDNLTLAFTGEYFKDDVEGSLGEEKDIRAHLSAYLVPVKLGKFSPYLSSGLVFTNRNINYNNKSTDKNFLNARFGFGVDYSLIQNLGLNIDFGTYTDGFNLVGFSSSFGLRYVL